MSQENAEILRRVYQLAEARGVEGLLELATDDIVWISDPHFPAGERTTARRTFAAG
jgi:ketosteroid isomerase-like protein